MKPRQLGSRLLPNLSVRATFGKGTHVFEVAAREAFHIREGVFEVARESVDDLCSPTLLLLPFQNLVTELPVELDEFGVDGEGSAATSAGDPRFK